MKIDFTPYKENGYTHVIVYYDLRTGYKIDKTFKSLNAAKKYYSEKCENAVHMYVADTQILTIRQADKLFN